MLVGDVIHDLIVVRRERMGLLREGNDGVRKKDELNPLGMNP